MMRIKVVIGLMILMMLAGLGCQAASAGKAAAKEPIAAEKAVADSEKIDYADSAAMGFALSQKKWCTNEDACSLVLHLKYGKDDAGSFTQRVESLRGAGIIPAGWDLQQDKPVTRGTLAYMVCKALDIRGGVMFRLTGARRYAYHEAVYQKLMPAGSEDEVLSGPEAVGVLGRAARWHQSNVNPQAESETK